MKHLYCSEYTCILQKSIGFKPCLKLLLQSDGSWRLSDNNKFQATKPSTVKPNDQMHFAETTEEHNSNIIVK